jgi:hypothetical protein
MFYNVKLIQNLYRIPNFLTLFLKIREPIRKYSIMKKCIVYYSRIMVIIHSVIYAHEPQVSSLHLVNNNHHYTLVV